jgi:hypothetical protein
MVVNKEKLEVLNQQLEGIRKQIQEAAKAVFIEAVTELFTENESLDSFGWRQWTPFWSDGEGGAFTANTEPDCIFINGSSVYEDNLTDGEEMSEEENRNAAKLAGTVSEILTAIGDSNLELMFGDHAEIVIRRNGDIEVTRFEDHD